LGALPLDIRIRLEADSGKPTVVADPDGSLAATYRAIASRIAGKVARMQRSTAHVFPKIVVQNT
jgi:ATP-binding protein involved in chromosome partitioning